MIDSTQDTHIAPSIRYGFACGECGAELGVRMSPPVTSSSDFSNNTRDSRSNRNHTSYGLDVKVSVSPCRTCIDAATAPALALKHALKALVMEDTP